MRGETEQFLGQCSDLKGYTFDYSGDIQSCMYQYIRSMKKIVEYVGKTFGEDVRWTIENLQMCDIPYPTELHEAEEYVQRKSYLERSLSRVYFLILGQCSRSMELRIEGLDTNSTLLKKSDAIGLIKAMKDVVFHSKYLYYPLVLCNALSNFHCFEQGKMSNRAFKEKFMILAAVVEELGGDFLGELGVHPGLIEEELKLMDKDLSSKTATAEQLEKAKEVSKEKFLACMLLSQADKSRYGELLDSLHNGYLIHRDPYPKTIDEAYELMMSYKCE